jgi:nitrous oxidase accessory protein
MWLCAALATSPSLQALVDAAPAGSVLQPPAGQYDAPLRITKPLTLDGRGEVIINGHGRGSVISVHASHVTLRRLHVTGTGESPNTMDAAIVLEGDDNRVEYNTIDDSLFGVLMNGAARSVVCGNRIASKPEEPSLRGDAVRVWNGKRNRVEGNEINAARDVSVANSADTVIMGNRIGRGRIGLQLVFSPRTWVEHNWFDANLTGVAVLYSDNVVLRGNRIQHSRGVSGVGIAFKESSLALVDGNEVVHCGVAVRTNAPTHPDNVTFFKQNRFAHNIVGMDFYGENGGHVLRGNRFEKNLVQVTVSGPMSARGNDWRGNGWDDYEGFDRDNDGVGDTPYEVYAFADRIFTEVPAATFFRNTPTLELLDFLERLAPFSAPELTLRDAKPLWLTEANTLPTVTPPIVPFCQELQP